MPALKPELVIALSNDYLARRPGTIYDAAGKPVPPTKAESRQDQVRTDTDKSLDLLKQYAKKVLIVDPVPTSPTLDPFACLSKQPYLEDCRFLAVPRTQIEAVYRGFVDNTVVYETNFDKLLCASLPICEPVIGGQIVRWDFSHLTPRTPNPSTRRSRRCSNANVFSPGPAAGASFEASGPRSRGDS